MIIERIRSVRYRNMESMRNIGNGVGAVVFLFVLIIVFIVLNFIYHWL